MGKKNEISDLVAAVIVAVKESTKVIEPDSQLASRGKFIVTTYDAKGNRELQHYADSKEEAKAWLQQPQNLGKVVTISKETDCLTTDIPLTNYTEEV